MSTTLPPELVLDILTRLPVKSLCRFRCVSKSWFALINHPLFVKMHLSRTQRHRLIIPAESLNSVDLKKVSSIDDKVVSVELDFPGSKLNHELQWVTLVSSCNGLLCITTESEDLSLYNPTTNECKQILDFDFRHMNLYGFGYAESIDDYKLVKIDYPGKFIEVYSLREDSWKSIQNDLSVAKSYYRPGVPLNGSIHWVVNNLGQNVIASFDLVEEKLETLLLPDIMTRNDCSYSLGRLRGCLCLLIREIYHRNELWGLNEYNTNGSWTRIFSVDFVCFLQPLCYLENDKTLLLYGENGKLVFCNSEDGKFKILEVDGIQGEWFDADVYVESLVSPNCRSDFGTEESLLGCLLK